MPAAAVASLTPAIAGISGTSVGASGETASDIGDPAVRARQRSVSPLAACGERWAAQNHHASPRRKPGPITTGLVFAKLINPRALSIDHAVRVPARAEPVIGPRFARTRWLGRDDQILLLRRRRHLGVFGCVGRGGGRRRRRVGGLVHALDLGALAELGDIIGLRLARHISFNLALDLIELRRLAVALLLDLDDVPAKLRLHGVGNLAWLELEGGLGKLRHHLVL